MKRVVVLGLDGCDPRLTEPLLQAGALPNLARLRAQGGYVRLATTTPAQTPVAWSTFATGVNPGGHGIFDFVRRDPATYLPDYSLTRYERKSAYLPPRAVNLRRATPLWARLSAAGIPSTVLRCPCTFPPDDVRGRMLSGMGVPDLRGGQGTSTVYASPGAEPGLAQEGERIVPVAPDSAGVVSTQLIGPRNPASGGDFTVPLALHPEPAAGRLTIRSDGQPQGLEVRVGQWSDWLRVRFKTGLLQSVSGVVRFHLVRLQPMLELYASPVNFDPEAPMFPISAPPGYARELARKLGTFYTTGMVEDHGGLNNGRFGEAAFLAQCEDALRERLAMLRFELARFEAGFLFCLFDTPDRIQHMFWRFRAGQAEAGGPFARVIEDHYHACDRVVGEVLDQADPDTLVVVLSDHGVGDFRRGVHLNTWLHDQGLLALDPGVHPGEAAGDLLRHVDWERTRAYALGLSGIYLNRKGREARGIVEDAEADALGAGIAAKLAALGDPDHGQPAVRSVVPRERLYAGPYTEEAPDLVVNFANGYRVSWGTALGAVPRGQFEDNRKRWSGDHLMDPALVPGVLFMNRPFRAGGTSLLDLAPTVLDALGAPGGAAMEGGSLLA